MRLAANFLFGNSVKHSRKAVRKSSYSGLITPDEFQPFTEASPPSSFTHTEQ